MTSPITYSIRPWPNGCSRSGFFPDRRKPTSVSAPLPTSERLFIASAVIETDPASVPTTNLAAANRILSVMATAEQSMP